MSPSPQPLSIAFTKAFQVSLQNKKPAEDKIKDLLVEMEDKLVSFNDNN